MIINKQLQNLKPSSTLAINTKVSELRSGEQKKIHHFGFGQSPFPIYPTIVKELISNATNNAYLPTLGLTELRESISDFLKLHQNVHVNSDHIFIGPGSKELLFHTISLIKSEYLVPKGSWVSYGPQIQSNGWEYSILNTDIENDFKLTAATLEKYCSENSGSQKTLILNSPNNPTGAVYAKGELNAIAKVCRQYDITVISDEIYSQINFKDSFSPSISEFYPEKTMVFGGLSKVFSAGGYRLGFMTLPSGLEFLKLTFRSIFSETFSAVSSPIQYAAIKAYKYDDDLRNYVQVTSDILKGISEFIFNKLSLLKIECTKSEGAFYMMIGFNKYRQALSKIDIQTSNQLADYLLENYSVALLPATDFYFDENDLFFRLAFVDFDGSKVYDSYMKKPFVDTSFIQQNCPNVFNGMKKIELFLIELSSNEKN